MSDRTKALAQLDKLSIPYEMEEHPAAATIEELDRLGLKYPDYIAKNLFVRDQKGKRHFLITICGHKHADLRALGERLGSGKLSFCSAERLQKYLGLVQGEVSPLGVVNDSNAMVEVVFDKVLEKQPVVGVHPCDNTATVYLKFSDLHKYVWQNGNEILMVEVD